jgi:uncharacterized protein YjbI with pentapeptide repeats
VEPAFLEAQVEDTTIVGGTLADVTFSDSQGRGLLLQATFVDGLDFVLGSWVALTCDGLRGRSLRLTDVQATGLSLLGCDAFVGVAIAGGSVTGLAVDRCPMLGLLSLAKVQIRGLLVTLSFIDGAAWHDSTITDDSSFTDAKFAGLNLSGSTLDSVVIRNTEFAVWLGLESTRMSGLVLDRIRYAPGLEVRADGVDYGPGARFPLLHPRTCHGPTARSTESGLAQPSLPMHVWPEQDHLDGSHLRNQYHRQPPQHPSGDPVPSVADPMPSRAGRERPHDRHFGGRAQVARSDGRAREPAPQALPGLDAEKIVPNQALCPNVKGKITVTAVTADGFGQLKTGTRFRGILHKSVANWLPEELDAFYAIQIHESCLPSRTSAVPMERSADYQDLLIHGVLTQLNGDALRGQDRRGTHEFVLEDDGVNYSKVNLDRPIVAHHPLYVYPAEALAR